MKTCPFWLVGGPHPPLPAVWGVVFSALEHPSELLTHRRWDEQLANFTEQNSINLKSLHVLLKQYEEAFAAGIVWTNLGLAGISQGPSTLLLR